MNLAAEIYQSVKTPIRRELYTTLQVATILVATAGGALKFQGGSEKKGVSRFKISKDWHLCFMCTFVHLSGDKKNVEELDLFFSKTIGSQIFLNIIQVTL